MYNTYETVLPIHINGQCPIIKTCSDVTFNLSSNDYSETYHGGGGGGGGGGGKLGHRKNALVNVIYIAMFKPLTSAFFI